MNITTIDVKDIQSFKLSKEAVLFDFIGRWEEEIKPHLTSKEATEALKEGFSDHFHTPEECDDYPWEDPRLDLFGAIGFDSPHDILGEDAFRTYIGEDWEAYFQELEDQMDEVEDASYTDWVKPHSYLAYRASCHCHHLAPFTVAVMQKAMPEYEWFLFETPAHSNAIGTKDGVIHVVADLLWGEMEKSPHKIIADMFEHSVTILRHRTREQTSPEMDALLDNVEKVLNSIKTQVIAS